MYTEEEGSSSSASMPMPFKIGLELQEIHNCCPWALENYKFQRKPLFELKDRETDRKLWHVVIDGLDLEFVAAPFARHEKSLLIKAIDAVQMVSRALKERLYNADDLRKALHTQQVINLIGKASFEKRLASTLRESHLIRPEESFPIWREWLISSGKYLGTCDATFEEIWSNDLEPTNLQLVFKVAKMGSTSTPTFAWWVENIERALPSDFFLLTRDPFFDEVLEQKITVSPQIEFQPQVTIQYPLEYTIPLLFGLYGHKSKSNKTLIRSLPYYWGTQGDHAGNFRRKNFSKLGGFLFLHALTLSGVVPGEETTDTQRLEVIRERYRNGGGQVDAKGLLYFMSRRPFSEMLRDLPHHQEINLLREYILAMRDNPFFARKFFRLHSGRMGWRRGISPDYAEEFYNGGILFNLSHVIGSFKESFLRENRRIVEYFLERGIISITMIRHLGLNVRCLNGREISPSQIFETFLEDTVRSVTHPASRFRFNPGTEDIEETVSSYDLLSPPPFLDEDDSMGLLKESEKYQPKIYGEAIVELRVAKHMNFRPELFLTSVENLIEDMDKLFEWLYSINKEAFLTDSRAAEIRDFVSDTRRK